MAQSESQPVSLEDRKSECKPLVLVIDDNAQYGKLLELLSEKLGITAHIVPSCGQAIAALKKLSFDVILMDWLMPEVDGPACTGQIRELEKQLGHNRTPIIGVTGYVKASHEKCLEAGMDDFLPVPFTLEQLHDKLCAWLQTKQED
jgi:CheY-like chemotaxis protein